MSIDTLMIDLDDTLYPPSTGVWGLIGERIDLFMQERVGLPAERITLSSTRHMYWTVAQLVAHHSVNGCALQPGDLFGSGTLSGETPESCGSLLEITGGGKQPLTLPGGETRTFLEDGDEVVITATAPGPEGTRVGLGEVRGRILPPRC
jgi:fumarylacetoacetase